MGHVSSVYDMAPSPVVTGIERELRIRSALRRCLYIHGLAVVRTRLLEAPPSDAREYLLDALELEAARSWLFAREAAR